MVIKEIKEFLTETEETIKELKNPPESSKKEAREEVNIDRGRAWVLTWSCEHSSEEAFSNLFKDGTLVYYVFGRETSKKGYKHLQCYVEYGKKITFSKVVSSFTGAYVKKREGSQKRAIEYCKKDGDWKGLPMRQGQPGSVLIKAIVKDIQNGESFKSILDKVEDDKELSIILQNYNSLVSYYEPERTQETYVVWIYGPTMSGKTTGIENYVKKKFNEKPYVMTAPDYKWWPGYDGEKHVILDEYRKSKCKFTDLLSILKGIYRIKYKGGPPQLLPSCIYIYIYNCP